jgi:hypothetical protein
MIPAISEIKIQRTGYLHLKTCFTFALFNNAIFKLAVITSKMKTKNLSSKQSRKREGEELYVVKLSGLGEMLRHMSKHCRCTHLILPLH